MNKVAYCIAGCSLFLMVGCASVKSSTGQNSRRLLIENHSALSLTDKAIAIKRNQILKIPEGTYYPLILSSRNDTIPSQLDDLDGDNRWDELFFVANLPPNATQTYSLTWVTTPPQYNKRTSVRFGKRPSATIPLQPAVSETVYARDMPKSLGFQKYQTDGPSWENDKVGFRHYLDGRNAKDVFGKRIPEMSPETVGINAQGAVEDNYHVMEKWGRDILAVGNSVGIGGIALLKNNHVMRLGVIVDDTLNNVEKTTFNIVTEGPVRSILNFHYYNWKPADHNYEVNETTSIWPGMYAYHNSVSVTGTEGDENLLIGIVNLNATHPPVEVKVNDQWIAIVSHEKHSYNKEWWLGLALILPADAYIGFTEAPKTGKLTNSYLAKMKLTNQPVNYYAVAGWELSDEGFKDPAYFQRYVEQLTQQIAANVTVTVR